MKLSEDGKTIVFDSRKQHEAFEKALSKRMGIHLLLDDLIEKRGEAEGVVSDWWNKLIEASGRDRKTSRLIYDWATRTVCVTEFDKGDENG